MLLNGSNLTIYKILGYFYIYGGSHLGFSPILNIEDNFFLKEVTKLDRYYVVIKQQIVIITYVGEYIVQKLRYPDFVPIVDGRHLGFWH